MGNERYDNLLKAIELERKAEEDHHRALSSGKSITEKVESGIVWYPVQELSQNYTVGEQIELTLERTKHLDTPHKFKSGVGCHVFKMDGTYKSKEWRGVISYVKRNKLAVILGESVLSLDDLSDLKGNMGVEIIYDDRPYSVMRTAIETLCASESPAMKELRIGVDNMNSFESSTPLGFEITPEYLNQSQTRALNGSLESDRMSIIHGPPGTGKTTTLIAVIRSLLKSEKRILVCAPSNNAVDLLARHLDMAGVQVLRIGNVTRIADELTHLTLIEKARYHPDWQNIKKVKIEAAQIRKQAGKFKRRFGEKEKYDRRDQYREAKDLMHWARDLEKKLINTLIQEARVICTTLIGVSHKSINDLKFNTLVIDEASQALEPECWNAILKAERVILAGDHLQLAPTVKSIDAEKLGLGETLLTRMTDRIKHTYLLTTQYRMNEKILSFSNQKFYDNKLQSDPQNATRTLEGDDAPLVLVDTSGCGFDEQINERSLSKRNEGEYFIFREHFLQAQESYKDATIGVIAPYSEQVKYLRSKIEEDEAFKGHQITVNSIDGFQGQEKDVIYISLVRSNPNGEVGFLADERRLNVAMTRARKKLIIIGDMSTLSVKKLFSDLADHVEMIGEYKSAWEYMGG